jgi:hypothetical protein
MVISLMTKRIEGAAIAFALFVIAASCSGLDIGSMGDNTSASNNTSIDLNIINSSLNSTNGTVESILAKSTNKSSDLWNWGDVPAGYVRKDGKIVPEAYSKADESVMETPSMLSPNPNVDSRTTGLIVRPN